MRKRLLNILYHVGDEKIDPSIRELIATHLIDLYQTSGRAYHNLGHITQCLKELDRHGDSSPWIELALWYHDIVYVPKNKNNEELSCERARFDLSYLKIPEESLQTILRLIIATNHRTYPNNSDDERIITDIDLSILGQPEHIYLRYSQGIRKEYSDVDPKTYREGRLLILQNFIYRGYIYQTDFFRKLYEKKARENIKYEIYDLENTSE